MRMVYLIEPVKSSQSVSFGSYQNILKTLYKKGQMPSVERGLYGELINPKTVSLEHLKPASWGGQTVLGNLALAHKDTNSARGSKPLKDVLTWDMLEDYLSQFNFKIRNVFDGYKYQDMVRSTCENLGMVNPAKAEVAPKKLPKKILRSMRNKAKKAGLDYYA